ncbi:uncharacterized protein METZ01_LOCUS221020 [marine metagenome]|uniref:Uncharacterized protein n=1 Tax=marine metagenome TaxID=408172 RepID=A0A382FYK7_9ZZZZ
MKKITLYLSLFAYSTVLMAQPAKPDLSIVDAAAKGDLEKVRAHLAAGTDINERAGEHESTALHAAAYYGNLEIVKFLIEKGADMNAKNKHGQTPRDVAWHDHENREKFSEPDRESKRKAGEFIESKGGEQGKSPLRFLAFLPCLIPIFLVLGIIYAIKTKPKAEAMPTSTKKFIVVTSPTIPGKKIVRTLGLVRGNTIRARHVGKDIMAGLRNIVGGEVTEYAKLLAESREQALDRMLVEAEGLGANAIVSVAFTTSVIMGGAAEMMAYGTAVVVEEEES